MIFRVNISFPWDSWVDEWSRGIGIKEKRDINCDFGATSSSNIGCQCSVVRSWLEQERWVAMKLLTGTVRADL